MNNELKKMPSKELHELYVKTKDFLGFLDKEFKSIENLEQDKEGK